MGDVMKKYFFPILFALVIGFLLAFIVLKQYQNVSLTLPTLASSEKLYFLQQGVYSSKESMEKNTSGLEHYIYSFENNQYYVYVGITRIKENADKLKGFFTEKGYSIYIKELSIQNQKFLAILDQYDSLLQETQDTKMYTTICGQVLSKYEEN